LTRRPRRRPAAGQSGAERHPDCGLACRGLFDRIAITQTDSAVVARKDVAIDQAHRAAYELPGA